MTITEVLLIIILNVLIIFELVRLAYVAVIQPLTLEVTQLREAQQRAVMHIPDATPAARPANMLPDMDNVNFEVGEYGDDGSTPEEVDEEMSELQVANREAHQAWLDLEELKHGKGQPLIYSGNS